MSAGHALTRAISARFAEALTARPPDPPIDVACARVQHAAYVAALAALGVTVVTLPAGDEPDGCFVEDGAVVAGGVALITRPGAASRRAETHALAEALAPHAELRHMAAPATLEGGDCLRVGRRLFVGRSARSNDAGIARLGEVFGPLGYRVVAIALPARVLHLKCVCSPLGDGRVLVAEGALPGGAFEDVPLVTIPAAEAYAANCLARAGHALMADGYPRARAQVEAAGLTVTALATSELRKADGALTCLSVVID